MKKVVFNIYVMIIIGILFQGFGEKSSPGNCLEEQDTLYCVATAHLDTQWRWTIRDTIQRYIPNTLTTNFERFEQYPGYVFSFEGSFRYMLMKEYYPELYQELKEYIAAGNWQVVGSCVDAADVLIPSPESLIRHILYGNDFTRREFGTTSYDIFLPDCFGFGYALPTIMSHCGLKGISTQKLTWGSWIPMPFDIGRWRGVDGSEIIAALNPGCYTTRIREDLSYEERAMEQIQKLREESGLGIAYKYFGIGDTGGAPSEECIDWLQKSVESDGPIRVKSTGADQLFLDLTPEQKKRLAVYDGELLMSVHATGCYTSQAAMKRWNRQNELLADSAERSAVIADWFGGALYPRQAINESWIRFLWHQMHDDLTGTSIPKAYEYSWNDLIISLNRFSSIFTDSVGAVTRNLDTRAEGIPLVVFNPLSVTRKDVVQATVFTRGKDVTSISVQGPDGKEVPSQLLAKHSDQVEILFLARVPSLGFAVYDVQLSREPGIIPESVKVSENTLENSRLRVQIDNNGDVASIIDKKYEKELLDSPIRLEIFDNPSYEWPAWEILYETVAGLPREYVKGNPRVRIVEEGPVRVALEIVREAAGSTFTQEIRLTEGDGADRVEFHNTIDWYSKNSLLKAAFPVTISNPGATYDMGIGTIERGNNTPNRYEVPAQQWVDITDVEAKYGIAFMSCSKYGWDKPADNIMRLTLLHTPETAGWYEEQAWQDMGHHKTAYALHPHKGDWREDNQVSWRAAQFNQPLAAFQTRPKEGPLGKILSFGQVDNSQVAVRALKKAENSDEIVVRLQELAGKPVKDVRVYLGRGIVSAREITGAEDPLGSAVLENGVLVTDFTPYQPRSFALTLAPAPYKLSPPSSKPVTIPFDADVISLNSNRKDGAFSEDGYSLAGELLPNEVIAEGIPFKIGPVKEGKKNALSCRGQKIQLPAQGYERLYLLAANAGDDIVAEFTIDGNSTPIRIQSYDGYIGQWDRRLINNNDIARDNPLPGYIRRDPLAWIGTHRHTPEGEDDAYRFTYLYKYSIPLPPGAKELVLPNHPSIRIMALTLADNPNEYTQPAGYLYDSTTPLKLKPDTALFFRDIQIDIQYDIPSDAEIRYTTDSTEPTDSSQIYDGKLVLKESAQLRARAFRNGVPVSRTVRGHYTKGESRKADKPGDVAPGLRCEYYEGDWNLIPDFDALSAVHEIITEGFDISSRTQDEYFGFRYTGFINIEQSGVYTFEVSSDDGSRLWIGDKVVVDHDGLHGMSARKGQIILEEGMHEVTLEFFQKGGDWGLQVAWSGPDISWEVMPGSVFFHETGDGSIR